MVSAVQRWSYGRLTSANVTDSVLASCLALSCAGHSPTMPLGEIANTTHGIENRIYERARQDSNLQPSDSKSEAVNPQLPTNTPLTASEQSVLASPLAQIVQKHPELAQLIQAWPDLPQDTKAAIKAIVNRHKAKNGRNEE